jgi:hypothetical protein
MRAFARSRSGVPLPEYKKLSGLSKVSPGAFQVAEIMNFSPAFCRRCRIAGYIRPGSIVFLKDAQLTREELRDLKKLLDQSLKN